MLRPGGVLHYVHLTAGRRCKPPYPLLGSSETEPSGSPQPQRGTNIGTLARLEASRMVRARGLCASAHPAMREARAPAGQHQGAAPSRSAAGKSATVKDSHSSSAARQDRTCASDRYRQAETLKAARWSEPAQTGLRNRTRCGSSRRRQSTASRLNPVAERCIGII